MVADCTVILYGLFHRLSGLIDRVKFGIILRSGLDLLHTDRQLEERNSVTP